MEENVLLSIHLSLKELQITQQQILEKIEDTRGDLKEMDSRVSVIETKVNYAAGFVIPVIAAVAIAVEWIRVKIMGA